MAEEMINLIHRWRHSGGVCCVTGVGAEKLLDCLMYLGRLLHTHCLPDRNRKPSLASGWGGGVLAGVAPLRGVLAGRKITGLGAGTPAATMVFPQLPGRGCRPWLSSRNRELHPPPRRVFLNI